TAGARSRSLIGAGWKPVPANAIDGGPEDARSPETTPDAAAGLFPIRHCCLANRLLSEASVFFFSNEDLSPMIRLIRIVVGLLAFGIALPAIGQAYPSRVVRIIVPFPPGGTVDAVARVVAQSLSEQLGQQFIVENKPGANGTIGSDLVAKSKPDGYNLCVQASPFATTPLFLKNVPYDVTRDFTPLSNLGSVPLIITAHPNAQASTLREFIDVVRAKPGKYAFGHSSLGSASHLAEEAIKREANLDTLIVPYKGTGAVITDLLGGHVNAFIDALPSSYPLVKSGKVKPLAVTTSKRISLL